MNTGTLKTENPKLCLIEPDIERDAALGVQWLNGENGHRTLELMGVADKDNRPTTLAAEKQRVTDFIEREDQLNWMIEFAGKVVGSVWVDLRERESVPAPSVHIMIGDPAMRGKGIGHASIRTLLDHLTNQGYATIYSRHLTQNTGAESLLGTLGFRPDGTSYTDPDGLHWQNVKRYTLT